MYTGAFLISRVVEFSLHLVFKFRINVINDDGNFFTVRAGVGKDFSCMF